MATADRPTWRAGVWRAEAVACSIPVSDYVIVNAVVLRPLCMQEPPVRECPNSTTAPHPWGSPASSAMASSLQGDRTSIHEFLRLHRRLRL
eukprot:854428-Amphidinium_carterae.1